MKSVSAKPDEMAADRKWWVVDAANRPLGRLSCQIANLLRGKLKPSYTPHVDCGDHVIVINAGQVALTGRKAEQKMYYRHSGYPGGIKEVSAGALRQRRPDQLIEKAVKGMLPRTVLGREAFRRLRVYAGAEHPHGAQQPQAATAE
ncbi:MAG: 50S ribosomal protein L13 [Fimbriimonadaceae bacterium]|nr:50S ribosomal protein L13 [Fimbriimonadaceae bacterium]